MITKLPRIFEEKLNNQTDFQLGQTQMGGIQGLHE